MPFVRGLEGVTVAFAIVIVRDERAVVPLFSQVRDRVPPSEILDMVSPRCIYKHGQTRPRDDPRASTNTITCTPAKRKQTIDRQRVLYTLHKKSR